MKGGGATLMHLSAGKRLLVAACAAGLLWLGVWWATM